MHVITLLYARCVRAGEKGCTMLTDGKVTGTISQQNLRV